MLRVPDYVLDGDPQGSLQRLLIGRCVAERLANNHLEACADCQHYEVLGLGRDVIDTRSTVQRGVERCCRPMKWSMNTFLQATRRVTNPISLICIKIANERPEAQPVLESPIRRGNHQEELSLRLAVGNASPMALR